MSAVQNPLNRRHCLILPFVTKVRICIMELLDRIFRNRIHEEYGDDRKKILPWILVLSGMTVAAGLDRVV